MTGQPIGIFGGTFDPVHLGHLRSALELAERLGLQEVRMVLAGVPPHRGTPATTVDRRWRMLELALADQRLLQADAREVRRAGPSYMVDTLASFRAEFGERPLCLLLGSDAFLALPSWHRWEALFDFAHVVVAGRPGQEQSEAQLVSPLRPHLERRLTDRVEALTEQPAGLILFQPVTRLEISATLLRGLRAQGRSIRYLTPEPVRVYIESEGLYQ
jgi:nicotinate-nucleotide adenylyltransferase